MQVPFSKYHGAGNDFIFIDNREGQYRLTDDHRKRMCSRHFGIGADGLAEIRFSDVADFKLIYYNSDGKEGSLCGNGSRCAIAFAIKIGVSCSKLVRTKMDILNDVISVEEKTHDLVINKKMDSRLSDSKQTDLNDAKMGQVIDKMLAVSDSSRVFVFEASDGLHVGGMSDHSTELSCYQDNNFFVYLKNVLLDDVKVYSNGDIFLNTGSPHHVTFVSGHPENVFDVVSKGRGLRFGLYGEKGSNINFVAGSRQLLYKKNAWSFKFKGNCDGVVNENTSDKNEVLRFENSETFNDKSILTKEEGKDKYAVIDNTIEETCLYVRTYERGVEDETLSCGTGCVAVAIADYIRQVIENGDKYYGNKIDNYTLKEDSQTAKEVWYTSEKECLTSYKVCLRSEKKLTPGKECSTSDNKHVTSENECLMSERERPTSENECLASENKCLTSEKECLTSENECLTAGVVCSMPEKELPTSQQESPTSKVKCSTSKAKCHTPKKALNMSIANKGNSELSQIENTIIDSGENNAHEEKRTIQTKGGILFVKFKVTELERSVTERKRVQFSDIKLSGPAEHVFDGVYVI